VVWSGAPLGERSRLRRTLPQTPVEYYTALGGTPPDYLAQPISGGASRPLFTPQTAYIHPRVAGDMVRYFEWMGAACYTADQRSGAMHGKQFLMDEVFAGIDEEYVYGRLDFAARFRSTHSRWW